MEANQRNISSILTEDRRYEIPPYQRPYSWKRDNVDKLVTDLWEAFEANDDEYFMGSLITIERVKGELYEVVDGQQRLTTLNFLFARLRDAVTGNAKFALGRRVFPENDLTSKEGMPRLTLREQDQPFFRRHVLDAQPITDAIARDLDRNQDSPKLRIKENLEAIDMFITGKSEETLKHFANYILKNVYLVFVTTESLNSAHKLFNVLNARGMPLSNADLIKNMLFQRLKKGQDGSELNQRWLDLEELIGIDRMDQFLGHHRTSILAIKARKAMHEEFEPLIKGSDNVFALLDTLTDSAKNYARIIDVEFDDAIAKRAVRSLHRVGFEEWIPPLLAFLNSPETGMSAIEFAVLLEKVTYQNWVRRLAFTARLTAYFQLINAIKANKSAEQLLVVFKENANNEEFKSLLNGDVYGKPFAQAVLLRLEESDQDESVTKEFSGAITIEHVLPQALKDKYWLDRFGELEHRSWVNRIGNLALLIGKKNYKAQYFAFDKKKAIYAELNNKTSFDTTKQILAVPDWNDASLSGRQSALMDSAIRIWSIG